MNVRALVHSPNQKVKSTNKKQKKKNFSSFFLNTLYVKIVLLNTKPTLYDTTNQRN